MTATDQGVITAHIYRAIFEIDDMYAPLSDLIEQAQPELMVMAAGDGARIIGPLEWSVAGERLLVEAAAIPVPYDIPEIDLVAVERACNGDPVQLNKREVIAAICRLERQGLAANEIARRLSRSYKTIKTYREQA